MEGETFGCAVEYACVCRLSVVLLRRIQVPIVAMSPMVAAVARATVNLDGFLPNTLDRALEMLAAAIVEISGLATALPVAVND